jgi:hypothetical protein
MNDTKDAFFDQRSLEGGADPSGCTNDYGGAFVGTAHERVNRQGSASLCPASKR